MATEQTNCTVSRFETHHILEPLKTIEIVLLALTAVKLDKGALIYAPEDRDEYITYADEEWAKQLPAGSPWYLHPGALDRELAKMGVHR